VDSRPPVTPGFISVIPYDSASKAQLSGVMNELEKSERLVEGALQLVSSVQELQKAEKESIAGLLRDAHG
jgi:hypothetical protein